MSLKSACCTLQTLMMNDQRESGGADREMEKKPSITSGDDLILPGFRFHPTDEELVGFYLRRKVEKKPTTIELIKQIDIYKYDPWDLPSCRAGEKEWYFFCLRERKYRNSIRPNRVTGSGFWKATGIDKPINSPGEKTNCCIGLKKSLVYYRGSAGKGAKTDWMMHEFRLPFTTKNTSTLHTPNNIQEAEIWTICRIFRRRVSDTKHMMRPNWKEESIKQNTGSRESTSQRSIYEFSDAEKERLNYFFGASTTKPVSDECEEKKHLFPGRSSLPNSDAGKSYKYENWDELGAVVDFAIDPNL